MKKIKLTQGKVALVDNMDYKSLSQWRWYFAPVGYAAKYSGTSRKNHTVVYMHTLINKTPKGFVTDHINRNKLDNRRENLRTITRGKNQWNRGLNKNNTSGHKGVTWFKALKCWNARIKINYKNIHLGFFKNKFKAIKVRKEAELIYHSL